jgi:hypothetical protein
MFKIDNLENDTRDETLSRQKKDPDHIEIQSALTYTTQFVNLIAFYLNLVLPYNLPHK